MLFPYQYVPHQMDKMQAFIDFIFYEVWCKAPGSGSFHPDLFDGDPDLKRLMTSFFYDHTKAGDLFYVQVERIYGHFAALPPEQIDQFKLWYQGNNDIERACANDTTLHLAKYADIAPVHQDLSKQLAIFFKELYSQQLLDLKVLRDTIEGDIDDHYRNFMQINTTGKCPFCGIGDIEGVYNNKREAYDHYLPKGLYPFNSINFRNLAPACHKCNSTYKHSKDPVSTAAGRRKAFYPYAKSSFNIEIKIDLKKSDFDKITPDDIEIEFGPATFNEEIETWKDVYGIEERYKAKCCGDNDGKYWLAQILDEWKEDGRSPADFLNTLARQACRNPLADTNFLKRAFLEGCNRIGLFTDKE
jgi:hypothetical protein